MLISDVHPERLKAAAELPFVSTEDGCSLQVEALEHYTDSRWTVHVFHGVVSIGVLADPAHIYAFLDFLDIPRKHRKLQLNNCPGLGTSILLHAPSALRKLIWS